MGKRFLLFSQQETPGTYRMAQKQQFCSCSKSSLQLPPFGSINLLTLLIKSIHSLLFSNKDDVNLKKEKFELEASKRVSTFPQEGKKKICLSSHMKAGCICQERAGCSDVPKPMSKAKKGSLPKTFLFSPHTNSLCLAKGNFPVL